MENFVETRLKVSKTVLYSYSIVELPGIL